MMLGLLLACTGDEVLHPTSDDTAVERLSIAALHPDSGPEAGGTLVRIEGAGFDVDSSVVIGTSACTSVTFLSSVELYCTAPPGVSGAAELVVTGGGARATAAYAYLDDEVDSGDTGEPTATISSCTLDSPASMVAEDGNYGDAILASVTVLGRTPGDSEAPGVEGAIGFGIVGSDPIRWEWFSFSYNASVGDADNYEGGFFVVGVGAYEYTARFRVDHGAWTTCELVSGGYGQLTATPPSVPVDYCHLQWPCSLSLNAGAESETVYAWIYHDDATPGLGAGAGIAFDLGIGIEGSDPETDPSWAWSSMSYATDKDGMSPGDLANDEYAGTLIAPATPGTYDYTARATADNGLSWTLCDLGGESCNVGGSTDGYDDPGECIVN